MCCFVYEYFSLCEHQTLTLLNSCVNVEFCTVYTSTPDFDTSARQQQQQRQQQRIRPASIYNKITAENDLGPFDRVGAFALNESFTACSTEYNNATADGHAFLQMSSSSPLRSLSALPAPNCLTKDGFVASETLRTSLWCNRAGSRCPSQTPLYGTNVTLFSSDAGHGDCSGVPSEVDLGHASHTSHAETGESVTADTPSIANSSDRTALGSNPFDGKDAAGLEENDDVRGRWRPQWPVPEPTTGDNWRPESPVPCGSSPYAAMPPDSQIQVEGGSNVPTTLRTNSPTPRRQDDGDDFPLLPKVQMPRAFTNTEFPKTTRYAINSTKPGMTWAERFKATIASPLENKLPEPPTELRDLGSVTGSSDSPTRGPGKQLDSMEVSDHTELPRVSISSPRTSGPVSQRQASLPIEWQVVALNTSPATTSKGDNSSSNAESSVRSSEQSTPTYSTIRKSQGGASRTDININKISQTIAASSGKATSPPDDRTPRNKPSTPISATERLVEANQHGRHLLAASRSTLRPSLLSATSASFTPGTPFSVQLSLPNKPSYAEVASLRLPALPCTPTTPSLGSGAFFSAPESPEDTTDGVHGVLLGTMAMLNLDVAAAAAHVPTTVLKTEGEILEKAAAGTSRRIVPDQSFRETQKPLSRRNSDQQAKKRKKKKSCQRKTKGTWPATHRSAGSLPGQLCSLTPSDHSSTASTWARSESNSAPLTPRFFEISKVDSHGLRSSIGTESPLRLGMLHNTSQMFTEVAKVAPCSKITIVVAAEHVGWYCPACYFKRQ